MAAIRSQNTRPELILRRALREAGLLGYRCHHRGLPGRPDIAFTKHRLAIFVDGSFWHGHPDHFRPGTLGEYWDSKIARTQERDREQVRALEDAGYTVLRFWDFEVMAEVEQCVQAVIAKMDREARRRSRPLEPQA
jgi:DNA mismatch endonuclease, patch repair protein